MIYSKTARDCRRISCQNASHRRWKNASRFDTAIYAGYEHLYPRDEGYPQTVLGRFNRLAEQLCISSITLAELYYGAEKSSRRLQAIEAIEQFVAYLEVVAFTAKAATHHGQLRAELERAGATAGAFDMLIGAHARSEGLIVVTRNTRDFQRMPGLRVKNWV